MHQAHVLLCNVAAGGLSRRIRNPALEEQHPGQLVSQEEEEGTVGSELLWRHRHRPHHHYACG